MNEAFLFWFGIITLGTGIAMILLAKWDLREAGKILKETRELLGLEDLYNDTR